MWRDASGVRSNGAFCPFGMPANRFRTPPSVSRRVGQRDRLRRRRQQHDVVVPVRAQGAQVRLLRVGVGVGVAVELEVDARLLGEGDAQHAQGLQPFGVAVNDDHLRGRLRSGQRVEELHLPHRAPRAEQQQAVAPAQVQCRACGGRRR
jgi:hypothetical protein